MSANEVKSESEDMMNRCAEEVHGNEGICDVSFGIIRTNGINLSKSGHKIDDSISEETAIKAREIITIKYCQLLAELSKPPIGDNYVSL